jgi:Zn-dependent M16 (insulinase) family peptidase
MLNGIYILVNFNDITCEKFYSKYKCNFNISVHKDIIDKLKQIEEQILKKYNTNKIASYKIYEQLKSGYIKIFTDVGNISQCSFILKISGMWETQYNYGLTYKFLKVS